MQWLLTSISVDKVAFPVKVAIFVVLLTKDFDLFFMCSVACKIQNVLCKKKHKHLVRSVVRS